MARLGIGVLIALFAACGTKDPEPSEGAEPASAAGSATIARVPIAKSITKDLKLGGVTVLGAAVDELRRDLDKRGIVKVDGPSTSAGGLNQGLEHRVLSPNEWGGEMRFEFTAKGGIVDHVTVSVYADSAGGEAALRAWVSSTFGATNWLLDGGGAASVDLDHGLPFRIIANRTP